MDSDMIHWHFDYVRLAWDSGFFFGNNKSNAAIDYSIMGLVDIEKIHRDRDYATVERHIPTIINFTLEEELSKILEPTFVKLFKLSQLSIEYLQFCKKYLDNTVILLKKELNDRQATCDNLRKESENLNQYVANLRKKNKDLKAHLQLLEAQNILSHTCPHCNKIFGNPEYLEAHINRRHTENVDIPSDMQIEADKLQLEIKELKERLNSSEKFVHAEQQSSDTTANKNDIHNKLELHKQHVEAELEAIRVANALKYETMLQRLQESQKPEESITINRGCNTARYEGSTQTDNGVILVDSNVNTDFTLFADENTAIENTDLKREIQSIKQMTEEHLQEFTSVLDKKVSLNLLQLESKLEMLLNKCSNLKNIPTDDAPEEISRKTAYPIEVQLIKSTNTSSPRAVHTVNSVEPKPAPRRQQRVLLEETPANITSITPKPRSKVFTIKPNPIYSEQVLKESPPLSFIMPRKELSSSETETESTSSSSSDESIEEQLLPEKHQIPEELKPTVRLSNTSTLRNISVTSLRKALDANVRKGLTVELEEILNKKLQAIGVSPDWKGIPKKSFDQAMKNIAHQNKATIKNYPNYSKCRESILSRLKAKIKELMANKKPLTKSRLPRSRFQTEKSSNNGTNTKKIQSPAIKETSNTIIQETSNFENINSTKSNPDIKQPPNRSKMASVTSAVSKKRVLFDLDTEESSVSTVEDDKEEDPQVEELPQKLGTLAPTGSTTSVGSSILDESKKEKMSKEKEQMLKMSEKAKSSKIVEEDASDWDVSDILVN